MDKIEAVIIEYLNRSDVELDAQAFGEIPEKAPDEFYVVELTGGGQTDHINQSTIAIKSHAKSRARAADLAYDVDNVMINNLPELDYVSGVKRNTVANFTDLATKGYRYQGVYVVTHY